MFFLAFSFSPLGLATTILWTSSCGFQFLRRIALKNICSDGYTHSFSAGSPALGIDDTTRCVASGLLWPGRGKFCETCGMLLLGFSFVPESHEVAAEAASGVGGVAG